MPCNLSITSAFTNGGNIIVNGSYSATPACTGALTIAVSVACGGGISCTGNGILISGSTFWQAIFPCACNCGFGPVTINATASCSSPVFSCAATPLVIPVLCCCPKLSNFTVQVGLCNSSGQRLATFQADVDVPAGCTATVQIDFGDGNFSTPQVMGSGTNPITPVTHPYATGLVYSAYLNVLSPTPCPQAGPISVICSTSCPPCATNPLSALLCNFLLFSTLFFLAVWIVLTIVSSAACVLINPSLPMIAGGFIIAGAVFFLLLFFICRKCICAFFLKIAGQLLLIVGVVLLMFYLPLNCAQPLPFATPGMALGFALVLILLGAILLAVWYFTFNPVCPLNICDFWGAISYSMTVAIFVAITVYIPLATGVTPTHLGFCLLVVLGLLLTSNSNIIINQNAGNC